LIIDRLMAFLNPYQAVKEKDLIVRGLIYDLESGAVNAEVNGCDD
jgi:hypothetical protein